MRDKKGSLFEKEIRGTKVWIYRAHIRSKVDPTISINRSAKLEECKTQGQADKAAAKLYRDWISEITRKELLGATWGQLVTEWSAALHRGEGTDRPVQRTTVDDNISALERFTSTWNRRPAEAINVGDVKRLFSEMSGEGFSKSRQKSVKSAINGAFRWGIETQKLKTITRSPAEGVSFRRDELLEEKKKPVLKESEQRKLLLAAKHVGHPWYPIWAMALLTGARSGELFALEWKNIDLQSRILRIDASFNKRLNRYKSTKAGSWREVPINDDLFQLLKEIESKRADSSYVLPRLGDWLRGEGAKVLRVFCRSIGITECSLHGLRASFATNLLQQKVSAPTVMKLCGWKNYETMDIYLRLSGIEIQGATDEIRLLPPREAMDNVVKLHGSS